MRSEGSWKFHIPKQPVATIKSIRFPNDLVEEIERVIRGTDCTFSAFVIGAARAALENLTENEAEE